MIIDSDDLQARYRPDQWKPEVRERSWKMVKTGTWFFGLFNTYALVHTDWEEVDLDERA